jgi:hypothetical protein
LRQFNASREETLGHIYVFCFVDGYYTFLTSKEVICLTVLLSEDFLKED